MGYFIDTIYLFREIMKLAIMVIISPMGIIGGLLLFNNNSL